MNFTPDDLVKIIGYKELEIHALKAQVVDLMKKLESLERQPVPPPLMKVVENG